MDIKRKTSKKRQAILDALCATKEHPTAEMLYNELKSEYPELSLGTVYRNLAVLLEDGSIITVGKVNGQERYDANTSSHAHFVCSRCHRVIDMDIPDMITGMYSEIEKHTGCSASAFSLMLTGLCNACLNK